MGAFLKWAGGKHWFIQHESNRFPTEYQRYIEPFLGGGSVYFDLKPQHAVLSDINRELITTYIEVRDHVEEVAALLQEHERKHSKEYYYAMRGSKPADSIETAARMIYLNKACFNGIYRVNRQGKFNVPIGKAHRVTFDPDNLRNASTALQNAVIECRDFRNTVAQAGKGDFLFCDPPYAPEDSRKVREQFVRYTKDRFYWQDQEDLAEALHQADLRGARFLLTDGDDENIEELYKDFECCRVQRKSSIAGTNSSRGVFTELVITNYPQVRE